MRTYDVFLRPGRPAEDPDLILVREGFSWLALFFPVIWLIWHRVWRGLIAYLAVGALVGVVVGLADAGGAVEGLAAAGFAVLTGLEAQDWRRAALLRQGYREVGVVRAPDEDSALARFLDRYRLGRPTLDDGMPA